MIPPKDLREEYKRFFVESEAGQYLVKEFDRLIAENYLNAEKNMGSESYYIQRAAGVRQARELITNALLEVKKKK